MFKSSVIFDLDSTLSNPGHRLHLIVKDMEKRQWDGPNWDLFHERGALDPGNPHIILLARLLHQEFKIVVMTGRPNNHREATLKWLEQHGVPVDLLLMREYGDWRLDTLVKQDLLDQLIASGYMPFLAVDDRRDVATMFRKNGIPCLIHKSARA